ncbi:MAG: YggT family protein [Pseudomonadaceae bacterium]
MNSLNTAAIYLLQTLGSLYLLVVLLRFLLQLVRADFYNPVSQFIVRATKPLLMPLRRIIPGYGGLDFASLVLALVIQLVLMMLIIVLSGYALPNIILLVAWSAIAILALFAKIFFFALIISVILSWVAQGSYNPAVILINQLCEPLLAPIRKILPALGGLDLSPIFAFIAIRLFDMLVIANLAAAAGMPRGLTLAL